MPRLNRWLCLACALLPPLLNAKAVVFWQEGFPSIETQPLNRDSLSATLRQADPHFADSAALERPETLKGADLLVLPYGSAFPQAAWTAILPYLRQGGNLLVLGGRPFRVPVVSEEGQFRALPPQDAYARELGILHTYPAPFPPAAPSSFAWTTGYERIFPKLSVDVRQPFVLEGRGIGGLGYLVTGAGGKIAAPLVAIQHARPNDTAMPGSRWVFLDFEPAPGY